jgi:hypothetical protein
MRLGASDATNPCNLVCRFDDILLKTGFDKQLPGTSHSSFEENIEKAGTTK